MRRVQAPWRHARRVGWLFAGVGSVAGLLLAASPVAAQEVAPRLTGNQVLDRLDQVTLAATRRAKAAPDAKLDAVVAQLAAIDSSLRSTLGGDAGQPVATVSAGKRDAVLRAQAGAKRVQAWLDASAVACTRDDLDQMLAALAATLDQLAHDRASSKAPPPVLDGIETIAGKPLFVLRPGATPARFVLTGENLVDLQCANPSVVAQDADGHPAAVQPQLVAAQPTRVEMRWPDAAKLAPGAYQLQLTTQRKAFLVGCVAQPAATIALQVSAPVGFSVHYALAAVCAGTSAPLGSGNLTLAGYDQTAAATVAAPACAAPTAYTLTASSQVGTGAPVQIGPVTQSADASSTLGIGHGVTFTWSPALHQVLARSGAQGCKGVD